MGPRMSRISSAGEALASALLLVLVLVYVFAAAAAAAAAAVDADVARDMNAVVAVAVAIGGAIENAAPNAIAAAKACDARWFMRRLIRAGAPAS